MPQSDIIHNQAIKPLSDNSQPRSGADLLTDQPRMLAYWRPRVQAWRSTRRPLQTGLTSELALERRAG